MFLQRNMALLSSPESLRLSLHIDEMGTSSTCCVIPISSKGLPVLNCAFSKSFSPKESESVMTSLQFAEFNLCFQCGGIHSYQYVAMITRSEYLTCTDVYLKT